MLGDGDHATHHRKFTENEVLAEIREWDKMKQSQNELSNIGFACGTTTGSIAMTCEHSKTLRSFHNELLKRMSDKDNLIANMVKFNIKIKEKSELQSDLLKSQKQVIKDLKDKISSKGHFKTPPTNNCVDVELADRCQALENQVRMLEEGIKKYNEEDENVRMRSDKAFEDLFKGLGRGRVDDSVLSIIDFYERKLSKLRNSDPRQICSPVESPTTNFKLLLKAYENKLDSCNKKIRQLQTTNEVLKAQIISSEKSLKRIQPVNVKSKNSRSLSLNKVKICPPTDDDDYDVARDVTTNQISNASCQKYLEVLCKELKVDGLEGIIPAIQVLKSEPCLSELENFHRQVAGLVNKANSISRSCRHEGQCGGRCLISKLEDWSDQIHHLKNLQDALENLSQVLFPWQPMRHDDKVRSVVDLTKMVDDILKTGSCKKKCKHDDLAGVDRDQLVKMIEHFQKLFDVPNAVGIVTRMSQLYVKLSENYNVMVNIKELLGLGRSCSSLAVLDKISKLSVD